MIVKVNGKWGSVEIADDDTTVDDAIKKAFEAIVKLKEMDGTEG